jgi:hypothetical protein
MILTARLRSTVAKSGSAIWLSQKSKPDHRWNMVTAYSAIAVAVLTLLTLITMLGQD